MWQYVIESVSWMDRQSGVTWRDVCCALACSEKMILLTQLPQLLLKSLSLRKLNGRSATRYREEPCYKSRCLCHVDGACGASLHKVLNTWGDRRRDLRGDDRHDRRRDRSPRRSRVFTTGDRPPRLCKWAQRLARIYLLCYYAIVDVTLFTLEMESDDDNVNVNLWN